MLLLAIVYPFLCGSGEWCREGDAVAVTMTMAIPLLMGGYLAVRTDLISAAVGLVAAYAIVFLTAGATSSSESDLWG